ncbi:retrovirus-related pol polyprotein from transposon TNT 1-94 [Tanacetum coccineum]
MEDEMNSLRENNTVELVKLPKSKRALKKNWVYKLKTEEHTSRPRYKAKLVVKGFSQKRGIDFDEIFSPVVKMGSIRVVLGLVATLDLEVEQMDVKTDFLHGDLDKEIYMEQPEAPRQWYKKFESVIRKQGYRKTSSDHCVFFQKFGDDDFIILLLYVDDMLIVGKNIGIIATWLPEVAYYSHESNILRRCYAGSTWIKLKWPDLVHAVGVVSRFLSNPGKKHWEAVKWIFRYLRGTSKLGITFGNRKPMLVGFTDSDMARNKDNMKSTSGYLMTFTGGAVSWQSR